MVAQSVIRSGRHELQRWMDDLFGAFPWPAQEYQHAPLAAWDDEQRVYLELELPGIANSDVDLTVNDGKLLLTWERREPEGQRWFDERRYGKFQRVMSLPKSVDPDAVSADLKDGVLRITFTKRPESQPRRIDIKVAQT
jgi:HSP20 family protein